MRRSPSRDANLSTGATGAVTPPWGDLMSGLSRRSETLRQAVCSGPGRLCGPAGRPTWKRSTIGRMRASRSFVRRDIMHLSGHGVSGPRAIHLGRAASAKGRGADPKRSPALPRHRDRSGRDAMNLIVLGRPPLRTATSHSRPGRGEPGCGSPSNSRQSATTAARAVLRLGRRDGCCANPHLGPRRQRGSCSGSDRRSGRGGGPTNDRPS